MKITYFKAVNFAGIYAGTGKYEIEIDFKDNNNNIILTIGQNGSGKSVLMSILHPFRETFDDRSNMILENKEGYKEIHLQKGKNIYVVKHHYGKNSSKNKAYITKNNIELNENGGIKTFADVLKAEFNLTADYFAIGKVGSNISGFIGKSTANRKAYINNFIPNIDEYLEAFEIVNEKYKEFNKDMKSLKTSIEKINIDELTIRHQELETSDKSTRSSIKQSEKNIALLESELEKLNERLKDIPTDIKELYEESVTNYELKRDTRNAYLNKYPNLENYNLDSLVEKINSNISNIEIQKVNLSNTTKDIDRLKEEIGDLTSNLNKLNNELDLSKIDFIEPLKITNEILSKRKEITELNDENVSISSELNDDKELIDYVTNKEFSSIHSEVENFFKTINTIKAEYTLSIIEGVDLSRKDEYKQILFEDQRELIELDRRLNNVKKDIFAIEQNREKNEHVMDIKPSDCFNSKCVFITDAIKFVNEEIPRLNKLIEEETSLENKIRELDDNIELLGKYFAICNDVNKYIIEGCKDYTFLPIIISIENDLQDIFVNTTRFESQVEDVVNKCRKYKTNLLKVIDMEVSLEKSKSLLALNKEKEKTIKSYEEKIKLETEKKESMVLKEVVLNDDLDTINKQIKVATNTNKLLDLYKDLIVEESKFSDIMDANKEIYDSSIDDLCKKASRETDISDENMSLKRFESNLESYSKQIEDVKNNMFMYKTYSDRLKLIEGEMRNIELVKDAVDPKKGIPLIFMNNYLNIISKSANELLDRAYGGDFKIAFEVTSKEFLIKVFKSDGTELRDISEASQGELALTTIALSLAMMDNLLKDCEYNILYLDEVDATLSASNRRIFLELLKIQLEKSVEQCFVISHNDEFYSHSVDLILMKDNNINQDDIELMSNKTILFDIYNNNK